MTVPRSGKNAPTSGSHHRDARLNRFSTLTSQFSSFLFSFFLFNPDFTALPRSSAPTSNHRKDHSFSHTITLSRTASYAFPVISFPFSLSLSLFFFFFFCLVSPRSTSQSMALKKGCSLISCTPARPRRLLGSRSSMRAMKCWPWSEMSEGRKE